MNDGSRIRINLAANAIGRVWSVVSIYLFVPVYLKMLGIEAYGVIGFYAVMQGIMTIANVGLTETLTRELALGANSPEREKGMRDLVRTIETIYWLFAFICGLIINIIAGPLVAHWIHSSSIPNDALVHAIRLMGWAVAFQFPAALYQGGLLGLQKQVTSNLIQILWGLIRNGGIIIIMILLGANLVVFFSWQLAINLLYSLVAARFLWYYLPAKNSPTSFRIEAIRNVWKYAAGMALISIISVIFMQLDKLVVSRLLTLKEFGYYVVGGMVAQIPTLLSIPIAIAIFPKLTSLAAEGDRLQIATIYHRSCKLVATLVVPISLVIAFFPYPVILLWTHSPDTAANSYLISRWFIVGSLFLSFQIIPYHLALAYGHVKTNLILSCVCLVFSIPLLLVLVARFGGVGGGISWAILNIIVLLPLVHIIHNKFLPGETIHWYLNDIGGSILFNIIWMIIIKIAINQYFYNVNLVYMLLIVSAITAVLNWIIIPLLIKDGKELVS